jgi:hypothetical protein
MPLQRLYALLPPHCPRPLSVVESHATVLSWQKDGGSLLLTVGANLIGYAAVIDGAAVRGTEPFPLDGDQLPKSIREILETMFPG